MNGETTAKGTNWLGRISGDRKLNMNRTHCKYATMYSEHVIKFTLTSMPDGPAAVHAECTFGEALSKQSKKDMAAIQYCEPSL
jgi:2-keto-3-deoxy-galactonokinase